MAAKPGAIVKDASGNKWRRTEGGHWRNEDTGKLFEGKGNPGQVVGKSPGSPASTGYDLGVNKKTGQIDPGKAVPTVTGAESADVSKTFEMQNPAEQTDIAGNRQIITRDPVTGRVSITQTGGGTYGAASTAFSNALAGLGTDPRENAYNATYRHLTANLEQDKTRDMEQVRQDLANRGIPPGSPLYAQLTGDVDRKYQKIQQDAQDRALTLSNETLATNVGAASTLGSTLSGQSPAFTAFQGGQSQQASTLLNLLNTISDADLQKYNIDKNAMIAFKKMATDKEIAGMAASAASDSSSSPLMGGPAPGFNV